MHHGEKFHRRSCSPKFRQSLTIDIGIPISARLLGGKTKGYHAAGAQEDFFKMQRRIFVGAKLAAGFFQQRGKALFIFLVVDSVDDDEIEEYIQGDTDHNDVLS